MSNKKIIPKSAVVREDAKTVKMKIHTSDNKPVWRFSTVDANIKSLFKWPKGQQAELDIVSKLHQFDSMLWSSIEGKQHHFLSASSLSPEAKKRLKEIELDDEIEHLFSFHLQGKPRIIAIRHSNVAKLLWYDHEHKVAPSHKKHT